jgi:mono/diheme cytochrome c family protein
MADGEAWGHTPIISRGTVHVRREIGLVPVEADGSAHFTVPALRSISLNVLNAEGMALMRMGSDMHVMPGETQSCIGCHENRKGGLAPPPLARQPLAAAHPPVTPTPADWGTDGIIDYQKVVQPVWDAYCISCHSGRTPKAGIDLTGDRTRFFCESYDHLVERALVDWFQPFANDYDENTPRTLGAIVSRIRPKLEDPKHCGKVIPPEMRRRVWAWIDANVPYYGTYTYATVPDARGNPITRGPGARCSWQVDGGWNAKSWRTSSGGRPHWFYDGVKPVFDKRCMDCHQRETYNGGTWGFGGGPMDQAMAVSSRLWQDRGLAAHMATERYGTSILYGPEFRINLTRPENSALLTAPLAKAAGGRGLCNSADGSPVFATADDPDYQTMLRGIRVAQARLYAWPRVDMATAHVEAVRKTLLTGTDFGEPEVALCRLSAGLTLLSEVPLGCVNLARGALATSDDKVPVEKPSDTPEMAIDGKTETFWDDRDNAPEYELGLTFAQPSTLSILSITGWQHEDFAPRDFTLLADGKPVGGVKGAGYQSNRLVIRFPKLSCTRFALRISAAYGGSPAIRELELYE